MKNNYENFIYIKYLLFIFILLECLVLFSLFNIKINKYKVLNGIVIDKNRVEIVIKHSDKKLFDSNKNIYIDNKKYSYNIDLITKNVVNNYDSIIVELKTGKCKKNDVIKISILDYRVSLIDIFKVIWKEE